jgi:hypothetical protein
MSGVRDIGAVMLTAPVAKIDQLGRESGKAGVGVSTKDN